jgi:hypothetical protein
MVMSTPTPRGRKSGDIPEIKVLPGTFSVMSVSQIGHVTVTSRHVVARAVGADKANTAVSRLIETHLVIE